MDPLVTYLPSYLTRPFTRAELPPVDASVEEIEAAALFADVSGFTPLAEHLAHLGPDGTEQLSNILSTYFGEMVDIVTSHGGDIVLFAGDAMLAIWPSRLQLTRAVLLAATCALAIQERLHNYRASDDVTLSVHLGVGCGPARSFQVPGNSGRRYHVLAGELMEETVGAEHVSEPGSVILSEQAWARIQPHARGYKQPHGKVHLKSVHTEQKARPRDHPPLPASARDILRAYLPDTVAAWLDSDSAAWCAELRRVTVTFVGIGGLDYHDASTLGRLQETIACIESSRQHFGGSINQFMVDDKGTVLLIVHGVPPHSYQDNELRALRCATALSGGLSAIGLQPSIGLASGRVFCGPVGNQRRRCHTVLGNVVNLAARLMQAARNGILCDQPTYEATAEHVDYQAPRTIHVKGKDAPVPVFSPRGESQPSASRDPMIGRDAEQALLQERLYRLGRGESSVVLIEADAGMGKTRLIQDLIDSIHDVCLLRGCADPVETSTAYFVWRDVFDSLLESGASTLQARRERVVEELADADATPLLATLNVVLRLGFPESDLSSHLTGRVRADNANNFLLALLRRRTPHVLVIEDAHWLDSASWDLLLRVAREVQPVFVVVSLRPMGELTPPQYTELLQVDGAKHFVLNNLCASDTLSLAALCLGAERLAPEVATLIVERSEGNPFYAEELALSLRDEGVVQIDDGECQLTATDNAAFNIPNSIEGAITSRIDRLPPSHQVTLKAASVIGRNFEVSVLSGIYPVANERTELLGFLQRLTQRQLVLEDDPSISYLFKHIIIREVAYNTMLFAQRRVLHARVAEWYEETMGESLAAYYPLLAHHWKMAEVRDKAELYLEKAAEEALRVGAYSEAVRFFDELMASYPHPDPIRQGDRMRLLGMAHVGRGNLAQARESLERSLEIIGQKLPSTPLHFAWSMFAEILRQAVHLAWRPILSPFTDRMADQRLLTYGYLQEVFMMEMQLERMLHVGILAANLGESNGAANEDLHSLYAFLAMAALAMGLGGLARRYICNLEQKPQAPDCIQEAATLNLKAMYFLCLGQFDAAQDEVTKCVAMCGRITARQPWEAGMSFQANLEHMRGNFESSLHYATEVVGETRISGNTEARFWGLTDQARNLMMMAQPAEAVAHLCEAEKLLDSGISRSDRIHFYGLMAQARWRAQDPAQARTMAERALELTGRTFPRFFNAFLGYSGVCEAFAGLVETDPGLRGSYQRAVGHIKGIAGVFFVGKPYALLHQGIFEWSRGSHDRAFRLWDESLEIANRIGMRYVAGVAHYEIGRHVTGEVRERHLREAIGLFKETRALWHLKLAEQVEQAQSTAGS